MSSLRQKKRQARALPPTPILRRWTLQRATGLGAVCGIVALFLAGLFDPTRPPLLYAYVALLAATAVGGASILWITAFDMRTRGTSSQIRPIRGFDLAIGLVLLLPALYALAQVWPALVE